MRQNLPAGIYWIKNIFNLWARKDEDTNESYQIPRLDYFCFWPKMNAVKLRKMREAKEERGSWSLKVPGRDRKARGGKEVTNQSGLF